MDSTWLSGDLGKAVNMGLARLCKRLGTSGYCTSSVISISLNLARPTSNLKQVQQLVFIVSKLFKHCSLILKADLTG